jgi:succinate dehydrogenase / fumarate reductase cytochrome b subunit
MSVAMEPPRPSRPRFLNLLQIRLPVTAVASISHRASGVLLLVVSPLLLYLLDLSIHHPRAAEALGRSFSASPLRFLALIGLWALAYHVFAGLRFLAIDLGLGESRARARTTAFAVLAGGVIAALLAGLALL